MFCTENVWFPFKVAMDSVSNQGITLTQCDDCEGDIAQE